MAKRILIRPKAIVDLDEQFAYIAENNFDSALIFFDAAQQTFAQLAKLILAVFIILEILV
jgi:toxin ParE1/3/4